MSMQWRRCTILTAIVMLLLGSGLPVLADGGGGGDERPTVARSKPDDPDYTAGVRAIKANRFAEAIPMLQRVVDRDNQNADAYNWLAYATRKTGDPAASAMRWLQARGTTSTSS